MPTTRSRAPLPAAALFALALCTSLPGCPSTQPPPRPSSPDAARADAGTTSAADAGAAAAGDAGTAAAGDAGTAAAGDTGTGAAAPDAGPAGAAMPGYGPGARQVALLVTADLWGQLAPCGCSENMRGGIDRTAAYVRETAAAVPALVVDAGDALFDELRYEADMAVQARLRAETMARALASMKVQAKAVFERDRTLPEPLGKLPPEVLLTSPRLLEAGGVKVGLVVWDLLGKRDAAREAAQVASLRAGGAELVVAVVHGRRVDVLKTAPAAAKLGVDVIVGSHIDAESEGEKARASLAEVPVFFTQARGQSVLRVDFVLRPGGGALQVDAGGESRDREVAALDERISSYQERIAHLPQDQDATPFRTKVEELVARRKALVEAPAAPPAQGSFLAFRFVPMTEDRPADPHVTQLLKAYGHEVAQANLEWAKANGKECSPPRRGAAAFAGTGACVQCHEEAHAFWKETGHAHAYRTLVDVEKQYDLSCIGCHVTGWEKPGGVCRVDRTEQRRDVGCESCHGAGSLHVTDQTPATVAKVTGKTCLGCHTPENSTAFDHATYLKRVLGKGHGEKALGAIGGPAAP